MYLKALAIVNRSSNEGPSGHTNWQDSVFMREGNYSGYQTYSKLTYLRVIVPPGWNSRAMRQQTWAQRSVKMTGWAASRRSKTKAAQQQPRCLYCITYHVIRSFENGCDYFTIPYVHSAIRDNFVYQGSCTLMNKAVLWKNCDKYLPRFWGRPFEWKKKMKILFKTEVWQFLYVIVAVYFTYFEGLIRYRSTRISWFVSERAYN